MILGNALVLGALVYAWSLHEWAPAFYYASLQEDEYLEWATFWAFFAASGAFAVAALRQWRTAGRLPWFLLGVAVFCFVVAWEEISWGQRLFGYRPPVYFLEHNFQQELNVHNVFSTALRKLTLKAVIGGYGILLPLAALAAPVRRRLERLAVVAPPIGLLPAFAATLALYWIYPWTFSGEVVELMLGLGFLAAAAPAGWGLGDAGSRRRWVPAARVAVSGAAVVVAGVVTAALLHRLSGADPARIEAAHREVESLEIDFRSLARAAGGDPVTRCGVHKRLYSFVEKYEVDGLRSGRFSQLTGSGMPQERAAFFLDPWNSPYWVRDRCTDRGRRRRIFVYSFGPNRRRDSTRWEILGDDVGAVILARDS